MLNLEHISVTFHEGTPNEVRALRDLNLHVHAGDFITVIGANGAGKSTLFNVVSGVVPVDRGRILLNGNDVTNQPEHRRSLDIGRVFQNPMMGICPGLTIREHLSLAALRGKRLGLTAGVKHANEEWFCDLVKSVNLGLETRLDTDIALLSGGQRQAITLTMATMMKPKMLMLDEHTAALDPNAGAQVIDLTVRLAEEYGLTVIMITHSMQQAVGIGNRVVMMNRGSVLFDIGGSERESLRYHDLIERFRSLQTGDDLSDRTLMS
jgi:putative tryptophan/tyrosine transport system ATP-binding protein